MKLLFLTFLTWCSFFSNGQVSIMPPSIHYVSKWNLESLSWMHVGDKVLFRQECSSELPPEFPTGTVFFENVIYQKDCFSMSITFKDTVVVSVAYYLKTRQQEVLQVIGYSDVKALGSIQKGAWTYTAQEGKLRTVIVADRKKIVVIQTL